MDPRTIFKFINAHSPSEISMVPSLMQFTNELVERALKRSRYSHENGLQALQFFFWIRCCLFLRERGNYSTGSGNCWQKCIKMMLV